LVSLSKFWILGEFCSRKLTDIFPYRADIPQSTCTISGTNLINGVSEIIY